VLELQGLYKRYGHKVAVDHVDLHVPVGSFFGMVGPNGAGKSTTLAMAVGLLRPDAGHARVGGLDVWEEPERSRAMLGVLPDGLALTERLTGRELLHFHGRLRGLDRSLVAERVDELLTVMDLTGAERTLVSDYSTGMRKKIGLAAALLHGPRVLVLDEPFEAVDPVSAATLKSILVRYVAGGGTVVLSSHVMALVEQLCDTVAVMHEGRVVASGPVQDVRGGATLEEAFVALVGADRVTTTGLSWL
jgi:ABC-2 type transport system ATP-binding protein